MRTQNHKLLFACRTVW